MRTAPKCAWNIYLSEILFETLDFLAETFYFSFQKFIFKENYFYVININYFLNFLPRDALNEALVTVN